MIGLTKEKLGEKIMNKIFGLRTKTYSYLKDNNDEDKKAKVKKSVSQKELLDLEIIKNI